MTYPTIYEFFLNQKNTDAERATDCALDNFDEYEYDGGKLHLMKWFGEIYLNFDKKLKLAFYHETLDASLRHQCHKALAKHYLTDFKLAYRICAWTLATSDDEIITPSEVDNRLAHSARFYDRYVIS